MLRRSLLLSLGAGLALPGGYARAQPTPAAAAAAIDAATAGVVAAATNETRDLTIASFGGAWQDALREALFRPFQSRTGARLLEETREGGIDELRARTGTGHSWDVAQVEGDELLIGAAQGLFAPIDWDALGVADQLDPDAVNPFGLGAMRVALVLGYNPGATPQDVTGWADLFDLARIPGPRALRRSARGTLEIALLGDGVPPDAVYPMLATEAGADRAFYRLAKIRGEVMWWDHGSLPGQWLARREVALAAALNGRIAAAGRAADLPLEMVWNQALVAMEYWALPRTGSAPRRTSAFLRVAAEAGVQAALATRVPFTPTARGATALLPPDVLARLPSAHASQAMALDDSFWAKDAGRLEHRFETWLAEV